MKVSIAWLKELVDLKVSIEELTRLLPLRTIGLKEVTDDFIELDMKGYNRADLLSMRGVAREVSAITDSEVKFTPESQFVWEEKKLPKVKVEIEDNKLCQVYCVAKIEGLKVKSSSKEWVKKLIDSGIRSIDNVTDVTNLIMLEYGQTIHAFDAAKVADETMIVRLAKGGEEFVTLDGKSRKLTKEDLLITDPKGILSLSGIMGGKNSEITGNTNTILLEVAIFDPVSIRKSSQRFSLYSEASKRIQHGLTKANLMQALSAAIKMYEQLGGKLTAITLTGNLEDIPKKIKLTQEKINSLIGVDISPDQVKSSLKKFGFEMSLQEGQSQTWEVTVPYWRLDIAIEEDLIEEVARMYGYEKIPANELKGELPEKVDQTLPNFIYDLKKALADAGLTEVQTYSFYSSKSFSILQPPPSTLIKVANPISSETEYLRNNVWPNLVEVVGRNLRNGFKDIAIFEIGKAYTPAENGLPAEQYRLSLVICNGTENPISEFSVILSAAKNLIKLDPSASPQDDKGADDTRGEPEKRIFHPTRFKNLEYKGKVIGALAEVHPRILNEYRIEKRVAILEISIEPFMS